ncbi:MAG: hypothetical protein EAZ74_05245 [Alphaproteobacteria bacterium]|nr:MAG: hypothetical protein EAY76_04640 [Alphaproteobacteria bacterium]TAF13669.1 MAG: hypothetical protein EAZ74_05245 [Alphaproteobacteria bacterium]TAF39584.1 MAG: hypothetical protein EAZ66_04530 [Alphaproteobacteria bacterium]TAF75376.1 MAG: hypothetical protein EAZ52_06750 [Alphaproteobacteria bacterium]
MAKSARYAQVNNPMVQALVTGRYRFETKEQAAAKLEELKKCFTAARRDALEHAPEDKICAIFWIAGFSVSEEDEKNGFMGHYAFVTVEELPNGLYALSCVKLHEELRFHPRRIRPKSRMPNWGHPILRNVQKKKHYPTLEEAQACLDALQLEYPEVCIPNENKIYIMIYDRNVNPEDPATKYVLKIVTHKEGGYLLECTLNTSQGRMGPNKNAKKKPPALPSTLEKNRDEQEAKGYFASMVSLKRKKPSGKK